MQTGHLATITEIARTGSVTAAARNLGVAQSTASRHVRALEKDLGVQLVDRTAGSVVLTAAGRRLVAAAPRVLDAVEGAFAAASDRTDR